MSLTTGLNPSEKSSDTDVPSALDIIINILDESGSLDGEEGQKIFNAVCEHVNQGDNVAIPETIDILKILQKTKLLTGEQGPANVMKVLDRLEFWVLDLLNLTQELGCLDAEQGQTIFDGVITVDNPDKVSPILEDLRSMTELLEGEDGVANVKAIIEYAGSDGRENLLNFSSIISCMLFDTKILSGDKAQANLNALMNHPVIAEEQIDLNRLLSEQFTQARWDKIIQICVREAATPDQGFYILEAYINDLAAQTSEKNPGGLSFFDQSSQESVTRKRTFSALDTHEDDMSKIPYSHQH